MLIKYYLNKVNTIKTLIKEIAPGLNLSTKTTKVQKKRYQGMTVFLMFSRIETRPYIISSVVVATCFAKNICHVYIDTVTTILYYLKGTIDRVITYKGKDKLFIEGYLDSDWAGNKKSRKSTFGFVFMLNGSLVS